ncbi:MAG TPA: hypothetical protein VGE13_02610 [Candidatus Saccharimonadales bacterium]
MRHKLVRLHARIFSLRSLWTEELLALLLVLFVFVAPASAAMRMQERSLYMNSALPGATTSYKVSFRYMTPLPVGSVDMLFCSDPIPYHPCVAPTGLDVSQAVLSNQSGETGFSIGAQSTNHIVLTRPPTLIAGVGASYSFDNIKNPTDTSQAFSIRLRSHSTTDASGPQIDFGSVRGQVTAPITLETQVPPMLIFCAAGEVTENCTSTNENYYSEMGELSHKSTLTAQSQMAVGTNASGGFAITANGGSMSAGSSVIDNISAPSESKQGSNQFGINLVANSAPTVGQNPEGIWANAVASPDYSIPDRYKYVPGDVIAYSPNVSLMKKFTVSYVVNSREDLRPGVYSTTITYIASGRF